MIKGEIWDRRRLFYVVIKFIELPSANIEDYVIVPSSWIIWRKSSNRKIVVIVAYPNNEDAFETRERVKRKERPNGTWRFYMANFEYDSDSFQDADSWIAMKVFGTDEENPKNKVSDMNPEPQLDRKLRSANQSCWSEINLDKLQVTVKSNKNRRKSLPRMLIQRPELHSTATRESNSNLNNKCLKLNKNPKPVIITDHITAASGSSKQDKSIIITSNQVIQKAQTKTNYASNGEMNTEMYIRTFGQSRYGAGCYSRF